MKVLCFLGLLACVAAIEYYDVNVDNLDMDAIVADPAQLKQWHACMIDVEPCNEIQSAIKKHVPEAVVQACAKCSDVQKVPFKKFVFGLKEKLPNEFQQFVAHYDPENKYFPALVKAFGA